MWQLPSLDRIGPEQFADLFKSTPIATFGQLINATIVVIALYSVTDIYMITGWWLINLVMCTWTMWRWFQNRGRTITKLSSKAIPRVAFSGFLYALPWSMLVILFLGEIPAREELLMSIAVVGMAAAGSVQLARVYPAALVYLATILVPVIVKSMSLGEFQYYLLAGLSLSYIFYLFSIVTSSAITSIERSAALKDLEEKVVQIDEANSALERFATEDDLTGLVNRRIFHEQLATSVEDARRLGKSVSLLVCDLDHFKNINDFSGHIEGDRFLKEVANRIKKSANDDDIVARTGGDEFALIVKHQDTQSNIKVFLQDLMDEMNQPIELGGTTVSPEISIGVSVFPDDAHNVQTMLLHADMALHRGKTISRNQYWFFNQDMRSKLSSDTALESDLKVALSENQFELYYQPKVDIRTGRLLGFESLLRWRRSNGEIVAPGAFFPVAEERGLMLPISDFVIEKLTDDLRNWQDMGLDFGAVSVNIHPVQIKDRHRMERIVCDVERKNLPPEKIILEITEDCVVGRGTDDVPATLELMRDHKLKVSFDDFGTGYASLTHLRNLPVDEIKLDRSFISGIATNTSDHSIVLAMIKLANSLGLATVAEGIEEEEQHNLLLAMGCTIGQGYFYARPMDFKSATEYLHNATKIQLDVSSNITTLVGGDQRTGAAEKIDQQLEFVQRR